LPHAPDKVELLAAAAGITDGADDMDGALRRLADLLVPAFADAAWIDVLALRGEGAQLAELVPELRAAMSHDEADAAMIERSGLRSTMALPLDIGHETLGALGVGVGPSGRRYGQDELAFAELLAGRAALALANAQLVARLTAAERRLEGILGTLAEAVTVHDSKGKVVFANPAAARLLGLPDVQAVLDAEPGELLDIFDIRDAEGRPVYPEELPGARVIRGERPEPMLTLSTVRETGAARWFLTKATALRDETGATLAVNVIEDLTEERAAYDSLAEVAHTLQSSLLPDALPEIPGWELAAHYRPGQSGTQVGGDFYDVFAVEGGHMVLLGDVTGKGVAAAALTALVRHTARTAARFDPRPAAVLEIVDRALTERPRLAPVTMLCGVLRERDVLLAAGGHPLPLRARAGAPAQEVGECGVLLGALRESGEHEDIVVPVEPGDTLLLYTDGVTETPGDGERFGEERLAAAVDAAPEGADALLGAVAAELDAFERGTSLDDRAMLALRRSP
jgi:serine phosphatase RsbU (regulator of sigma subunit)